MSQIELMCEKSLNDIEDNATLNNNKPNDIVNNLVCSKINNTDSDCDTMSDNNDKK